MQIHHNHRSILPWDLFLLLVACQYVRGVPRPLVSSSGMMPVRRSSSPPPANNSSSEPKSSILRSFPQGHVSVVQKMGNKESELRRPPPPQALEIPITTDTASPPHPVVVNSGTKLVEVNSTFGKGVAELESDILREGGGRSTKEKRKIQGRGGGKRTKKLKKQVESEFDEDFVDAEEEYGDGPEEAGGNKPRPPPPPAETKPVPPPAPVVGVVVGVDGGGGGPMMPSLSLGFDEEETEIVEKSRLEDEDLSEGGGNGSGGPGESSPPPAGPPVDNSQDLVVGFDEGDAAVKVSSESDEIFDDFPVYKLGAPWEDPQIVGKMYQKDRVEPIEISFNVAERLCSALKQKSGSESSSRQRFYLWAPINQYVPMVHKAFPLRPPTFSPECLKWVLRPCRGKVKKPFLKPCTYWAPMRLQRPECGFNPSVETHLVNYRLKEFVPGNCPCVWPCTRRFDPIQRCRVSVPDSERVKDRIDYDGEPKNEGELEIQVNYAEQLCRAMKVSLSSNKDPTPIGWVPLRIDSMVKPAAASGLARKKRAKRSPAEEETGEDDGADGDDFEMTIAFDEDESKEIGDEDPNDKVDDIKELNPGAGGGDDKDFYDTTSVGGGGGGGGGGVSVGSTKTGATCDVWKYKACPKVSSSEEENKSEEEEEGVGKELRRRKRGQRKRDSILNMAIDRSEEVLTAITSGKVEDGGDLPIAEGGGGSKLEFKDFSRESHEEKDVDYLFGGQEKCGVWKVSQSTTCTPEGETVKEAPSGSAADDNNVHVICPGGGSRFPCFLKRKKRALVKRHGHADHNHQTRRLMRYNQEKQIRKPSSPNESGSGGAPGASHPQSSSSPDKKRSKREEKMPRDEDNEGDTADDGFPLTVSNDSGENQEIGQNNEDDNVPLFGEPASGGEVDLGGGGFSNGVSGAGGLSSSSGGGSAHHHQIRVRQDIGCMCDWPCLPFYKSINKCYSRTGKLLVNRYGKPVVRADGFRKYQKGAAVCLNFVENDEIYCRIKPSKHDIMP